MGKQLDELRAQTLNVNKAIIAEAFGRTASTYSQTLFLSEKFLNLNDGEIGDGFIAKIIEIEKHYSSSQKAYEADNVHSRLQYAKLGLNECEKLNSLLCSMKMDKSSDAYKYLHGYYYIRAGDLAFLHGYMQYDGERELLKAVGHFKKALNILFEADADDAAQMEKLSERLAGEQTELFCLVYIFNIIGLMYNILLIEPMLKRTASDKQDRYKELANKYCRLAYEIIMDYKHKDAKDKPPRFAVYIRNYGTTLERYSDKNQPEPCDVYSEAIKWNCKDYRSYQTYCSYMLRKHLREVFHTDIKLGGYYNGCIKIDKSTKNAIESIRSDILPKVSILQRGEPDNTRAYEAEITARSVLSAVIGISEIEKQIHKDYIERAKGILDTIKAT